MGTPSTHQLIYTASGDPSHPPLIMIHGWLSHRGVWRTTVPALQDRFYCIAVDLLGFADNKKPADADYSIAAQAQRVVALANEKGFKTFNVMGHSMGGQIATHIAAITAPERVDRLVSVDGVVTGRLGSFVENMIVPMIRLAEKMPILIDLMGPWVEKRWFADFAFKPWFYDMNFTSFESWKIDRQMATQKNFRHSAVKAYDSLLTTDLTPQLTRVQARTLIISGQQDGTVPVEQAHLMAERMAGARLVLYEACGHCPMFEKTEQYLATLHQFFLQ